MKKIVFLLYDSRSGSTLLSALLNRYRPICVSQESSFISRIIEYRGAVEKGGDLIKLVNYLFKEVHFLELGLSEETVFRKLDSGEYPLEKKVIITELIDLYFETRDPNASIWIIKHPIYHYSKFINNVFPDLKYLHIIRDGRAVYQSKRRSISTNGLSMQPNLLQAAYEWRKDQFLAKTCGDAVLNIFFEELIEDTDRVMINVFDFLGISDNDRVITKDQGDYYRKIGERQKHLHTNVEKKPEPKIGNAWRKTLSPTDIFLYECLNRRYLEEYNYPMTYICEFPPVLLIVFSIIKSCYYVGQFFFLKIRNIIFASLIEKTFQERINRRITRLRNQKSF